MMEPLEFAVWIKDVHGLLKEMEREFKKPWVGKVRDRDRRKRLHLLQINAGFLRRQADGEVKND